MTYTINYIRLGRGKPLLLIHGLGSSWKSWTPIINALALEREVIAIDLPGCGESASIKGFNSIEKLSDEVEKFIITHDLVGIDVVGSSLGGRIVLELARRGGIVGGVISLAPVGFWNFFGKHFFYLTNLFSIFLLRLFIPMMPIIAQSKIGRLFLFWQLSTHPTRLPPQLTLQEMRDHISSKKFDQILFSLAYGKEQLGTARPDEKPLMIVWGKKDRMCFCSQSKKALELFPHATIEYFDNCGHFPQWDRSNATAKLILEVMNYSKEFMHTDIITISNSSENAFFQSDNL